ncbi:MAG: PLP-dependent aminotransferase family protein [Clostridiales bacterium]
MLTYTFTDIGSDFLYEHLYKCIKNDILQGVLAPEEKLPSKRAFAKNLGISTITIENAYAQLTSEGYIYSLPKKGYFVTDIKNPLPVHAVLSNENVNFASGDLEYFADFASNQTDSDNFPFSIWSKLMRELLNDNRVALMTNPPCGGILHLREAIADHLKQFRGITVFPEQIIIGAGTEYLYGLLIQLLGHDKIYAVENPGYQTIFKIYSSNHVVCKCVNMDQHGVDISELENSHADIIHLSPSHHFPTGIVTPISRRYELLGWASKADSRYIVEDDYDSEFRLTGKPIPALQNIDAMEKVIYINTFTKSLSSTVRISYMVLPKHLVNIFYSRLNFYSCTVSNFEQYTLARFIKEGYFEKHINRMRNFYHAQRDLLLESIKKSPLSSYVTISEEDAGLHFLMRVQTAIPDAVLIRKAAQNGIKLSCLSQYYVDDQQNAEHIFIINYSFIKRERVDEAIQRLYQCL